MKTRMPTRITTFAVLIAATAAIPAVAGAKTPARTAHSLPQCANANLLVSNTDRAQAESAVVCLINQQRTEHGLPALRVSPRLDHSAQGWSNTIVAHNDFTHGGNFAGRISAAGFNWRAAGENIASGFQTPFTVVQAWMGDVGHCQNILRPMFDYVGTGLNATGNGGAMADTWTQDFGLLAGTSTGTGNMKPADGCPYKLSESATATAPKPTLVKPAGNSGPGESAPSVHPTPSATVGAPTISIG